MKRKESGYLVCILSANLKMYNIEENLGFFPDEETAEVFIETHWFREDAIDLGFKMGKKRKSLKEQIDTFYQVLDLETDEVRYYVATMPCPQFKSVKPEKQGDQKIFSLFWGYRHPKSEKVFFQEPLDYCTDESQVSSYVGNLIQETEGWNKIPEKVHTEEGLIKEYVFEPLDPKIRKNLVVCVEIVDKYEGDSSSRNLEKATEAPKKKATPEPKVVVEKPVPAPKKEEVVSPPTTDNKKQGKPRTPTKVMSQDTWDKSVEIYLRSSNVKYFTKRDVLEHLGVKTHSNLFQVARVLRQLGCGETKRMRRNGKNANFHLNPFYHSDSSKVPPKIVEVQRDYPLPPKPPKKKPEKNVLVKNKKAEVNFLDKLRHVENRPKRPPRPKRP